MKAENETKVSSHSKWKTRFNWRTDMTFMTSRTLFLLLKYLIQLMLEWNCFSLMKASSHKLLFLMTPKIWCERWDDVTDEVTDSYRVTKEIEKSLELPVITNKEILCLILTPVSSLSSSLSPKNTVSHGSVTCFLFCLTSWVFRVNHILMKGKRRRGEEKKEDLLSWNEGQSKGNCLCLYFSFSHRQQQ